jgi:peptide/nickel transport system substrate-binding protein
MAAALLVILLQGCGGSAGNGSSDQPVLRKAENGDAFYGGTFKYNETEYIKTLYPLNITEVTGHRIITNVYEGLVSFVQEDLSIEPALAERWDISEDGMTYTFYLRQGVRFHDDPCFPGGTGREVTARDFKWCLDRAAYHDPANNQGYKFIVDIIAGAQEYFELTKGGGDDPNGVSGVKVIDDYTLQIELFEPNSIFLSRMCLPFAQVYPKEAVEMYGSDMRIKTVGTGPFKLKMLKEDQVIFLERNEDYWGKDDDGNQLPYFDNIKVTFIKEHKTQLEQFIKEELDMVYRLPSEDRDQIVDVNDNLLGQYTKYQFQSTPSMALQYYGFLHADPVFSDKRVRQAFCYAVDRKKIADFTLKGSAAPAIYGMVPPGTGTYDATAVDGYDFNPERAQQLMAEAGYPKGEGFPRTTLQINSGGERNENVAEAVQKMLEDNLGINVEIVTVPWAQHTEAVENAKVKFWRLGWIADYPDPENFLNLFHGKWYEPDLSVESYINSFRYNNPDFDAAFDAALRTTDNAERNAFYAQADQVAIDDAVVLPIYYDKDDRLIQPDVRRLFANAMEYRNFKDVYFVPEDAL